MSEENEVLDASTEPDFLDSIPEDLRTESSFADINNVQDLARSYHNAQKMVGADKVAIPGPNADDSDSTAGTGKDFSSNTKVAAEEDNVSEKIGEAFDKLLR